MLGENRSKAAFRADSIGSVQKVKSPAENHEPVPEQPGKFEHLQFGPDYPVGDAGWKPSGRPVEEMERPVDELPVEPPAVTEEPEAPGIKLAAPEKARTLRTHDLFFGAEDKTGILHRYCGKCRRICLTNIAAL